MASRNYHFKFNTERDRTYIERLDAQDNMQNYIRRLILSDIAADSLKDIIRFENEPDRGEDYEIARQDYYSRECEALNRDADPECCKACSHYDYTYDKCFIEENFRREYNR